MLKRTLIRAGTSQSSSIFPSHVKKVVKGGAGPVSETVKCNWNVGILRLFVFLGWDIAVPKANNTPTSPFDISQSFPKNASLLRGKAWRYLYHTVSIPIALDKPFQDFLSLWKDFHPGEP